MAGNGKARTHPRPGETDVIDCCRCRESLPVRQFEIRDRGHGPEFRHACRGCNNRSRQAARYGLTVTQVNDLLAGGCAICGSMEALHVDHDHVTGAVRGCLCGPHNMALGLLHDNPEEIIALADYIRLPLRTPINW